MYVIIPSMKDSFYIDDVSKQWWHLWHTESCCLNKNHKNKKESGVDKSHDTRAEILLAAFNEIYKRGFQAASLSSILKNTEITKGALYHHFENKGMLGYAVLDEVIRDTIFSIWIEPLKNTDDPITILKETIIQSGASMSEEDVSLGCPLNNLAQEMSPIDEGFRDRIADIYQAWQDAIEAALDKGKIAGNVRNSIDSKEVALLFVASLQGCIGFAKSVQKLETLKICGKGLVDSLETLRPSKKI